MFKLIKKLWNWLTKSSKPQYTCVVYKKIGCEYVDPRHCNIRNCNTVQEIKIKELEKQLEEAKKERERIRKIDEKR